MGASKRVNGRRCEQSRAAKRVALVIPHLGMGGAQRVATYLANHWVAQGYVVAIITTIDGNEDFYPLDPGVTRIKLQPPPTPTESLWKRLAKGAARPFRRITEKCGATARTASRPLRRVWRVLWLVLRSDVQPFNLDNWRSQAEQGIAGHPPGRLLKALGLVGYVLMLPLVISAAWLLGVRVLRRVVRLGIRLVLFPGRLARHAVRKARRTPAELKTALRERLGGPVRATVLETLARRRTFGPFGYPYARFLGWYSWRVGALRRQLRELRPDVVLSMLGATNIITVSASRGLPHRLVISERNDPALQELQQPWQEMRPLLYPGAHLVTANSHGAVDTMRSFCAPHKLAYVPNPIIVGPIAPHADRRDSIVFLGRLVHQKAPELLVEAYAKLLESCPSWTLEIVGDGPMADELREQVRSLEIAGSVTFHGVLSDPSPILGRAQMFVLPSRFEGTPNALLEAMALKLACVVSDASPGPLGLVEHGSTGLVVKTGCADSLGEAMAKLARSKTLRKRLANKAYQRVQEFRIERVGTIWDELLFAETPARIQSNGLDRGAPIPLQGEVPRLSPSCANSQAAAPSAADPHCVASGEVRKAAFGQ